ncbi:MAG: hypothetical protein ACMUIP_08250 [bacterium]
MSEQVKAIVNQLQGKIEQANKEAEEIIEQAKHTAENIKKKARIEAKNISDEAQKKIKLLEKAHEDKLKQAVRDTLIELKEKTIKQVLKQSINKTFLEQTNNADVIKQAILTLCKEFGKYYKGPVDLKVLLGEELFNKSGIAIQKRVHDEIKKEIDIQIDPSMKGGFRIGQAESGYLYDFSDAMLAELFSHAYGKQIEEQIFSTPAQ